MRRLLRLSALAALCLPAIAGAAAEPSVLLLNARGDFLRFDRATRATRALWSLPAVRGFAERIVSGAFDGAPVAGFAYSPSDQVAYLVLPETARLDPDGTRRYRVVAAHLPGFEIQGEYRVPQPQAAYPQVLLSNDGRQLFVQWSDRAAEAAAGGRMYVFRISPLSTPGLEASGQLAAASAAEPGRLLPIFSPQASFDPTGSAVIDRDRIIRFQGTSFSAEALKIPFSPPQLERIARYAPAGKSGSPEYLVTTADVREGRLLVRVTADAPSVRTELLSVRKALGENGPEEGSLFEAPQGQAHLLPGGRNVLVREVDGAMRRPASAIRYTGRIQIWDAVRGERLTELSNERLAGPYESARFLCASPDSKQLIFRSQEGRPVVVEPATGKVWSPEAELTLDVDGHCAFLED